MPARRKPRPTVEQLKGVKWRVSSLSAERPVQVGRWKQYVVMQEPGRKLRKSRVFTRTEWEAFLYGARKREFDV